MSALRDLEPDVRCILDGARRAPSAHNAQPWRLVRLDGRRFQLWYDHNDYLPFDPDDRDAYLAMGAFAETLSLAAHRQGWRAEPTARFAREGAALRVADLRLRPAEPAEAVDPLAGPAADRCTNRTRYDRTPLPHGLQDDLEALGVVLVDPARVSRLVARASVLSWADRRFVGDLRRWMNGDDTTPVGMAPGPLGLARYEWAALRLAFRAGRLPAPLARAFASRDVRLLRRSVAVAVLGAASLDPPDLFDAGRRLLRAWVTICAAGWAYHPISIAVDRPETAPQVAALAGVAVPAAVFRIGHPTHDLPPSGRLPLRSILRPELA